MKPILFSTDMVRAILDGRKIMTRRMLGEKEWLDEEWGLDREPYLKNGAWVYDKQTAVDDSRTYELKPRYQPGDVLWVRETFCPNYFDDGSPAYKADYDRAKISDVVPEPKWRPSIHMPREAARLFLRVTGVQVDRLQEITNEDATREGIMFTDFGMNTDRGLASLDGGITFHPIKPEQYNGFHAGDATHPDQCFGSARSAFACLWDKLNFKRGFGWGENPWVWAISFEQISREEAEKEAT